jgi:ADP-heptose:LPS heptosyltransferase
MNKSTLILGGQCGQFGDCVISTVVARAIKEKFPSSQYIYGISKKYWEIEPLFRNHPYIDKVIQWEGYDNWPTNYDMNLIGYIKPDIFLNPMSRHPNDHSWPLLVNHQTEAAAIMQGFSPPKDLSCYLEKWFEIPSCKDYIAISPFTAWSKKNISNEKWQVIINYIVKERGFNVLQLGRHDEFQFKDTFFPNSPCYSWPHWTYFESVKKMLGCSFLICLDGSFNWVSSAYKFPVLSLLGYSYNNLQSTKLYQPINPNGHYLEAPRAEDIPNELIFQKIDEMIEKYY